MTVTYDNVGRRTDLRDPDLGWVHYDVDPLGLVWQQVSPNQRAAGTTTTMRYDALNRMVARNEPDLISGWTYDQAAGVTACAPTVDCAVRWRSA